MERRKFLVGGTAVALTAVSAVEAVASVVKKENKKVFFNHNLLFWLKSDLSEKQTQEFTQFFEGLRKLPRVKALYYGKPANSTPRKVVDNSFTYNLVLQFDSLEDLEAYGKHPDHLKLVQQYSPYWERMLVHDSVMS